MQDYLNAISLLPKEIEVLLSSIHEDLAGSINEIRFRVNKPLTLNSRKGVFYCTKSGRATTSYNDDLFFTDERKMQEIVFSLSRRSIHTYQDMLAKGFLPLKNGCKAGVAGCAVIKNGSVYSVSSFNSVNIRISREYCGCAQEVAEAVGEKCNSFLLVGQPLSGKTTLLRDLCRKYAGEQSFEPKKIVIVDERDEIASKSFGGGVDVGVHTDVLSLYPKEVGIDIALRTLSPDIIVLDEIGSEDEINVMLSGMNSGVGFIATAHGNSFEEVLLRPNIKKIVDAGVFKKAVVLKGKESPGEVAEVIEL
ncbi:MAG: Flp pilus assembly complex ATPase component TadA [Clostridia bacterium]|nr:Flp pilus assembly complex ATPase component TadA [Clostridia bacterium]